MIEFRERSNNPLHIIGTSETKILTEKIVFHLNELLSIKIPKETLKNIKDIVDKINQSLNYEILNINGGIDVSQEIIGYNDFSNEETKVHLVESVRGKHVYVVSDVNGKATGSKSRLNDKRQQTKLILQTAKKHGAKTVNVIFTCFPYSRQDKPTQVGLQQRATREPSSAQLVVDELEMLGVDYCITIDIHNSAIANAFKKVNFVNLYTGWFVQEVINKINKDNLVLSGMDEGCIKKIRAISKDLKMKNITVIKERDYSQKSCVEKCEIYGDVGGKNVLLHDDILDTGGSLCAFIEEIKKKNPQSLNIAITHGRLNGESIQMLTKLHKEGKFEKLYVTNSVCRENLPDFIHVVDASKIFANTVGSIFKGESINYNNNK